MIDVIITAAGSGSRFSATDNKLLMTFSDGKSVLRRSVEAFLTLSDLNKIYVTARAFDREEYSRTLAGISCVVIVEGGETRAESVANALCLVTAERVLVHDGARPFVSADLVDKIASHQKNVVPALPMADTVKRVDGQTVIETPDRSRLVRVQTPQGFCTAQLKQAYQRTDIATATDDASVMERAGYQVEIVHGEGANVKITYNDDKKLLSDGPRVGIGYDVHRLVEGRPLMLGCVEVPYDRGLLGHSDADVVAHAICDALLSAAGLRDIGFYFPDNSNDTEGMSGTEILQKTAALVRAGGAEIINVAVVAVAQKPKLATYIPQMNEKVALALGIPTGAVSVSATTTERLGFEGREEGISAQAVATIR